MAIVRSADSGRTLLDARRVNLLLEILVVVVIATGVGSWLVPLGWARPFTVVHALSAFAVVVLTPFKIRGSVRTGLRRNPSTRWLSSAFGVMVLGAALFGFLHTAGVWHGVGEWSALWLHHLLGFVSFPFFIWHLWSRRPPSPLARDRSSAPVPPTMVDLDRRSLLAGGVVTAAAGAVVLGVELTSRAAGSFDGRSPTGSRNVASFDPTAMPSVVWLDDETPADTDPERWALTVNGFEVDVVALQAEARPLDAVLDCTGGWWSEQSWDVVPLRLVLDRYGADAGATGPESFRSVRITSSTGYERLYSPSDADTALYLAVGYGGRALRAGHGAPVRVVAPGRRGPWWVKWVRSIEYSGRPAWLQLPLPPT